MYSTIISHQNDHYSYSRPIISPSFCEFTHSQGPEFQVNPSGWTRFHNYDIRYCDALYFSKIFFNLKCIKMNLQPCHWVPGTCMYWELIRSEQMRFILFTHTWSQQTTKIKLWERSKTLQYKIGRKRKWRQ